MAMNETNPFYLLLILVAGWISISCISSLVGGWFRLARQYPALNGHGNVIDSFRWRSLNLNYLGGYRGCVNIEITEAGLTLRTIMIFSILHNPVFLPWHSISHVDYKDGILCRVKFHIGKDRLVFYGKVAKKIYQVLRDKQP